MLETMAHLTHENCAFKVESLWQDGSWSGHLSVTEVELCEDYHAAQYAEQMSINAQLRREEKEPYDHEAFCEDQAELALERAFRSVYETDFQYLEESLLTAGGLPAWE